MFKLSSSERAECEGIMRKVLNEKPEFWPYGLDPNGFDGGLWLVKKAATGESVGFVGWQDRYEGDKHVGYYSVGILPEYRRNGLAKQAVTSLLAEKAAKVDVVRALIDHRNEPSKALARSIGSVQVKLASTKEASRWSALGAVASVLGSGYLNTIFWDQAMNPDKRLADSAKLKFDDKTQGLMAALNFLFGSAAGGAANLGVRNLLKADPERQLLGIGQLGAGATGIGLSGTKDLVMNTLRVAHDTPSLFDAVKRNLDKPSGATSALGPKTKALLVGAGLLGMGGLGLTGLAALRGAKALSENSKQQRSGGRVRVTLPTRSKGDAETQLELPIDDIALSNNLYNALRRDTRRRLRSESGERRQKFVEEQNRAKNLGINIDDKGEIQRLPMPA